MKDSKIRGGSQDMSSNRVLIIAFAASILLHVLVILLINFEQNKNEKKGAEKEPVEISIVPKEKPEPQPEPERPTPIQPRQTPPPPAPPPPMPVTEENEKTTLEHDDIGGPKKGIDVPEDLRKNLYKDEPRQEKQEALEVPKVESQEKAPEKETIPEVDTSGLRDTKDVVDMIANKKKEQPKGEDTASYNAFEERYASYFGKFRRRVYQLWNYPRTSIANGETGVVTVSFSILKDGSVVNIKMKQSSGYPSLDREVMRVLKNIGKIPLPESYELEQLNVDDAYFIYSMGSGLERLIR